MDILAELDHLADLRDQQTVLDLKRNELRDVVLAPIAQQLADIDAETGAGLRRHQHGTPRCGDESQGVHPGGRCEHQGRQADGCLRQRSARRWDSKRLDGYALAHPEIAACRTVGEPASASGR